jgi:hypothetical protein
MRVIWPNGYRAALVIGIDDVHPESSEDGCDCGGDMEKGVLGSLLKLNEEFPHVKITLFITPQWVYLPQRRIIKKLMDSKRLQVWRLLNRPIILRYLLRRWPEEKFRIDREEYNGWAEFISEKVREGRFNVGMHGLYHFQECWPPVEEFGNLGYEECVRRLREAKKIFDKAGIPLSPVFAPPGWKVTESLERALTSEGIYCIAGSICGYTGITNVSYIYPQKIAENLVNVPRNWVANYNTLSDVEEIIKKGGIIGIHAHIWQKYHEETIESGLSSQALEEWRKLFRHLEKNYKGEIWYTTFNEVAKYVLEVNH